MTIKELKDILNKYPEDTNIYISIEMLKGMSVPIKKVEESYTIDIDEPMLLILSD